MLTRSSRFTDDGRLLSEYCSVEVDAVATEGLLLRSTELLQPVSVTVLLEEDDRLANPAEAD